MKKHWLLISILCLIKLIIHFAGNGHYGFHRDELLHLSAGDHPDWGYMEFPPFIAFVSRTAHILFDTNLWGIRLFPTLAGLAILILCCRMAEEMGGKKRSVLLAGICILAFLPFFRNHLLFQPVAFDQLFWTLGFYYLIRYINTQSHKYLLLLGVVAGLGMMNKYTMVIWIACILAGLLFYQHSRLFKEKWLYIAGGIAFLIFLPNLIWQHQHDYPILKHVSKLGELEEAKLAPFAFGREQLKLPFTLAVSLIGIYGMFADAQLKQYRSIAIAVLLVFIAMWTLHSKAYYFFAAYPVLFAAGAVKLEKIFVRKPVWNYVAMVVLILPVLPFIPDAIPVLPIETYVHYKHKEPEADGRIKLTSDYADMFGWEEQVKLVDSVYQALSPEERSRCFIWAENYGEAGAVQVLGRKYDLPYPVCSHGSFWLWGPPKTDESICISIGIEKDVMERTYKNFQLIRMVTHPYAIEEENNIPVYIARQPIRSLKAKWKEWGKYVFD